MINTLNDLYRQINSPIDLYKWMSKHIEYGYVNTYTNKRILNANSMNENNIVGWTLSSPENVFSTKLGICHDQAWFINNFFEHKPIDHKVFYLKGWYNDNSYDTHTFIIFKYDSIWYHFENAWNSHNGIHMGGRNMENTLRMIINRWASDSGLVYDDVVIRELVELPDYETDSDTYMKYAFMSPVIII